MKQVKFKDYVPTYPDYSAKIMSKVRKVAVGDPSWLQDAPKLYTMESLYNAFVNQFGERVLRYDDTEFSGYFANAMVQYLPTLYARTAALVEDRMVELRTTANVGTGSTVESTSQDAHATMPASVGLNEDPKSVDSKDIKKYIQEVSKDNLLENAVLLEGARINGQIQLFVNSFNDLFQTVMPPEANDDPAKAAPDVILGGLIKLAEATKWLEDNFKAILKGNVKLTEYGTDLDWGNRPVKNIGDVGYILDTNELVIWTTLGEKRIETVAYMNKLIDDLREQLRIEIQENKVMTYKGRFADLDSASLNIQNPIDGDYIIVGNDTPYDMYVWGTDPDGTDKWLHIGKHDLVQSHDPQKLNVDMTNLTEDAITKLKEKLKLQSLQETKNYYVRYEKDNARVYVDGMPNGEYMLDFTLMTRHGNSFYFRERVYFSGASKQKITVPVKLYGTLTDEGYGTSAADSGLVNFIELSIEFSAHWDGTKITYLQIDDIMYYDPYAGYPAQVKNGVTDVSLQLKGAGLDVGHWLRDTLHFSSITTAKTYGVIQVIEKAGGGAHQDEHTGTHSETDFDRNKLIQYDQATHTELWPEMGIPGVNKLKDGYRIFYRVSGTDKFLEFKQDSGGAKDRAHTGVITTFEGEAPSFFVMYHYDIQFSDKVIMDNGVAKYRIVKSKASIPVPSNTIEATQAGENVLAMTLFVLPPDPKGGV